MLSQLGICKIVSNNKPYQAKIVRIGDTPI